ncbi:MAG: BMP family ABC transporter substrate-binding protein [Pseudolysinimonas sp.]|uniref:BMP family lipoprotein n=1 Tax=Pseudolysinimonas sp. TaxID=2680009 RepID=UPI003C78DE61
MNLITRKRALVSLALVGTSALALAGCAPAPEAGGGGDAVDYLACAVSDEGSWNDKSFNEAAFGGLLKAEDELGVNIDDAESSSPEDFEPNLTAMVENDCDVIFSVGFNFSIDNLIFDFAAANPEAQLVWIDGWNQGEANLKPIAYAMNQSSFLAGYLAAAYSTSKVVGTYGGMNIPAVTDFMTGYYNGAKYYEAETGTAVTVVGWDPATESGDFVGDFANTAVAQSISEGQLAAGADVLFPVAGGLFTASATAIRDSGSNAVLLGVDKDIALTQPELADIILTSVEKRMTQAVFDVIEDLSSGGEFTTDAYVGTLENDGTALSDFYDFDSKVSDETKAALEEITAGIIDGSIDPLSTP